MASDTTVCDVAQKTYFEFAENTCIHGLSNTTKWYYFVRLIWLLVVLSGMSVAIFFIFLVLGRYITSPTKTYIKTMNAPTSEIDFPAVTLCDNNQVVTSKVIAMVEKMNLYNHTAEEVTETLPSLIGLIMGRKHSPTDEKNIDWLRLLIWKNGYDSEYEVYREITTSCDEMLLRCMWDGVIVDCKDIFVEQFNTYGRCCAFNFNLHLDKPNLRSNKFGVHMGLKVVAQQILESVQYKKFNSDGVTIVVHTPSDYPSFGDLANMVAFKNIQFLHLSATKIVDTLAVHLLPDDLRRCVNSDDVGTEFFPVYSYNNCLTTCEIQRYLKYCNCVPFAFNSTGEKLCDLTKLKCVQEVYKSNESCYCPYECGELKYVIFSSGVPLAHDENAASDFLSGINITSASLVNIFYGSEEYTVITREISSNSLHTLSSIGGIFSLFLGCSFTSGIEIIYYIIIRFVVYLKVINTIDTQRRRVARDDLSNSNYAISTFNN